MGKETNISWTDHTYNPWRGCKKVSEGCRYCYMYRDQQMYGQDPYKVVRCADATFNEPLKWKNSAFVFTCSWSDFFIEQADDWRDDAWNIIRKTPHLNYQILTKRPENIKERLPRDWADGWDNVWLGVSVSTQTAANLRIPRLLQNPAVLYFVSVEPMLEEVDLRRWLDQIGWVICGGESGPHQKTYKRRWLNMRWVRELRDQCVYQGVPFFFKQDSDALPDQRAFIIERNGERTIWHQRPERTSSDPIKQQTLF